MTSSGVSDVPDMPTFKLRDALKIYEPIRESGSKTLIAADIQAEWYKYLVFSIYFPPVNHHPAFDYHIHFLITIHCLLLQ